MFRLIGNNESIELWNESFEIPVQLQNELLKLSNGMHMFAVGDTSLGWGYTVLMVDERGKDADAAALKTLEDRYLEVKRVTPTPSKKSQSSSVTYH